MSFSGPPSFLGGDFLIKRNLVNGVGASVQVLVPNPDRFSITFGFAGSGTGLVDTVNITTSAQGIGFSLNFNVVKLVFPWDGPLVGSAWWYMGSSSTFITIWEVVYQPKV